MMHRKKAHLPGIGVLHLNVTYVSVRELITYFLVYVGLTVLSLSYCEVRLVCRMVMRLTVSSSILSDLSQTTFHVGLITKAILLVDLTSKCTGLWDMIGW